MQTVIFMKCAFWFKKDLRLYDNTALIKASEECDVIYPIVTLDPKIIFNEYSSDRRVYFQIQALKSLAKKIQLTVLSGDFIIEIRKFMKDKDIDFLFYNRDYDPFIDYNALCSKVKCKSFKDYLLVEPGEFRLYKVFTPYYRKWKEVLKAKPIGYPDNAKFVGENNEIPELVKAFNIPEADEEKAKEMLDSFNDLNYSKTYTSRLSVYINFGLLSIRDVYWRKSNDEFRRQLAWRDFYYQLYAQRKEYLENGIKGINPNYSGHSIDINWRVNDEDFRAWAEGRTGIPIIDAAMRELNTTGYIHNRLRLLTSYFLVKVLRINWKEGAKYFMQSLIDGDFILNTANWQWIAGIGADTRPLRRFNIIAQGKAYDKEGNYIRRWVTELTNVPSYYIHEPWKMSIELQKEVGVIIGKDYPLPIADLEEGYKQFVEEYFKTHRIRKRRK